MQYRIRYSVYRVEASNLDEAKKKAISILRNNLEELVTIEKDDRKPPFWRLLLLGR